MSRSQGKTEKPATADRDWAGELVRDPRRTGLEWSALTPKQRREEILKAGAMLREKLITLSPDARQLVRSLPADEFIRTVVELGPEDSVGLLDLSTPTQLKFLFDLTGWREEKFSPARYQLWLPALMEAGPGPLNRWLKTADLEELALLFAFWFRVEKFLPSQDEQEPPDNLPAFTLDGVYFIDFHKQENAQFVAQVLAALKSDQPDVYTRALEAMLWEPASLLASEGLRWRNGRLADQGLPGQAGGPGIVGQGPARRGRLAKAGAKAPVGPKGGGPSAPAGKWTFCRRISPCPRPLPGWTPRPARSSWPRRPMWRTAARWR